MNRAEFRATQYDIRFTRETGDNPMTFHPLGLFVNQLYETQQIDAIASRGTEGFYLRMLDHSGWWVVLDIMGQYMTKFLPPTEPSQKYNQYSFISDGIWYVLEIRIVNFLDPTSYRTIDQSARTDL